MPGKDPQRAGSKLQALVRTLVDSAIAGNARAQSVLVGALARIGDAEEHEPSVADAGRPGNSRRLRGRRAQASRQ